MENVKILIANTGMDTDKIKVSFKGIYVEPAFTHVNLFLKHRTVVTKLTVYFKYTY